MDQILIRTVRDCSQNLGTWMRKAWKRSFKHSYLTKLEKLSMCNLCNARLWHWRWACCSFMLSFKSNKQWASYYKSSKYIVASKFLFIYSISMTSKLGNLSFHWLKKIQILWAGFFLSFLSLISILLFQISNLRVSLSFRNLRTKLGALVVRNTMFSWTLMSLRGNEEKQKRSLKF